VELAGGRGKEKRREEGKKKGGKGWERRTRESAVQ
jgi:hypothetical protein